MKKIAEEIFMRNKMVKFPPLLRFISRHQPNDGEIALAKRLGFDSIQQREISFTLFDSNPAEDLISKGIGEKTLAIVAPSHITNELLNEGYTLIEFMNSPVKREKMVFCCYGAYIMQLKCVPRDYQGNKWNAFIEQEFIPCPLEVKEQVESSLIVEKEGSS